MNFLRNTIRTIKCHWSWFKYNHSKSKKKYEIESKVGWYFYSKVLKETNNTEKAMEESLKILDYIKITSIKLKGNKLFIACGNPGVIIGKKGLNIEAMNRYFSEELKKKIKVIVKSDDLYHNLTPFLV